MVSRGPKLSKQEVEAGSGTNTPHPRISVITDTGEKDESRTGLEESPTLSSNRRKEFDERISTMRPELLGRSVSRLKTQEESQLKPKTIINVDFLIANINNVI